MISIQLLQSSGILVNKYPFRIYAELDEGLQKLQMPKVGVRSAEAFIVLGNMGREVAVHMVMGSWKNASSELNDIVDPACFPPT